MRRLPSFLGSAKPTLAHEAKHSALGIVFHAVARVKQACQEAVRAVLRAFKVEHVKLVARFEDAPRRTQRLPFFVWREVMEQIRGVPKSCNYATWETKSSGTLTFPVPRLGLKEIGLVDSRKR